MNRLLLQTISFYFFAIALIVSLSFYFSDFIDAGEQLQKLLLLISVILLSITHKIYYTRFVFYLKFLLLILFISIAQYLIYKDLLINRVISNLAFLSIGVFLFMVKFRTSEVNRIKLIISLAPILSVFLGLLLGFNIFRLEYNGALRLQGLLVPAHLAMLSSISIVISLFLRKKSFKRISLVTIILNSIILILTQTRGALLFTLFLTMGYFFFTTDRNALKRIFIRYLSPLLILLVMIPALINVYQSRQFSNADTEINTSGRLFAWTYFLDIGYERKYVGYGLGSSTEVTVNKFGALSYFKVPHNEFIKFFVEMGVIGSVLFWGMIYRNLLRNINFDYSKYRSILILGLILYAMVDNLFSTLQFYIPLMVFLNFINKNE